MEHLNKKAVIVGGAALLSALLLLAYLFSSRASSPQAVTRVEASPLEGVLGRELLATLSRLRSTKLDTSVFSDPVFTSLKDFGVEIAPQPVGRRNPFAAFEQKAEAAKSGSSAKSTLPAGGSVGKKVPPPTKPAGNPVEFDL